MKTIGIADFKKLVMERLANPRDYAGRSLVLWNADYCKYGIAYRVIEQCCKMYNNENPNDQVWFKLSDMSFASNDYTKQTCLHEEYIKNENGNGYHMHTEMKRCGILFNTGCYMLYDKENWLTFVNTHTNQKGGVHQDCAVIICAQADQLAYIQSWGSNDKFILKEEQFGSNCDIYSIQPTYDEWVTWIAPDCHPEILRVVRAFIEKNGAKHEPYGFDLWQRTIDSLYNLVEDSDCSLNQIPRGDVKMKLTGSFGTNNQTVNEFIDFIYEQSAQPMMENNDIDLDSIWDDIDFDSMNCDDINPNDSNPENPSPENEPESEITDENHVNSDAETKENKDSDTIMTQIKLFEGVGKSNIEECVNQFLQENANSIKVIDIKYTTYVPSERSICRWTAMVIYETL